MSATTELREQLELVGIEIQGAAAERAVDRILEHVGDGGLVVDALLMRPRPHWVWELIGSNLLPNRS